MMDLVLVQHVRILNVNHALVAILAVIMVTAAIKYLKN
jgi:hypothetical protein